MRQGREVSPDARTAIFVGGSSYPGHPLIQRLHILGSLGFEDLKQPGFGTLRPHLGGIWDVEGSSAIMGSGPTPSVLWLRGPNSIIARYLHPLFLFKWLEAFRVGLNPTARVPRQNSA